MTASRRAHRLVCIALTAALLALASPVSAAALVLAKVDDDPITLEDLKREFESRHQGHASILGDETVVHEFLEASVKKRLFVHEGRRMGLEKREDVRAKVAAASDPVLSGWLFETEITSRAKPSPDQIAAGLEKMKTSRNVVLVQCDTRGDAEKAGARLRQEPDAEAVAREMSTARSRLRGGMERVGWGAREEPLETAIFTAKVGEVAGPVATEEGWVVAKVLDSTTSPTPLPARAKDMAEAVVARRLREAKKGAYLDGLRTRYGARIHEDLLDPETLSSLVEAGDKAPAVPRVVAEYRGGSITRSEMAKLLDRNGFLALRPERRRTEAAHVLSDRLDQDLLRLEGARRLPEAPQSVRAKIRQAEDDLVFQTLLTEVVFREVDVTDAKVHDWYVAHRGDYVEPVRVRLAAALLSSQEDAASFLAAARGGDDFAALVKSRSKDKVTAARGGDAGWVSPDTAIPQLRDEAFKLAKGGLGGPTQVENGWLVYKVLDRKDGRQLGEDEARDKVRGEVLTSEGAQRRKEWEGKLRKAARVQIDDAAVRKAVVILAQEERERFHEKEAKAQAAPPGSPHGVHR